MNLTSHQPIKYRFLIISVVVFFSVMMSLSSESALKSTLKVMPFGENSPEKLFNRGEFYRKSEQLDSALICYSWIAETYKDATDEPTRMIVGKSLSEMGQLYYVRYNDYTRAYECLVKAEKIFAGSQNRNDYARVLLNFGNLFNMYEYIFPNEKYGTSNQSRDYYKKSFRIGEETKDWDMVCSSYINMSMMDIPFKVDEKLNHLMYRLLQDSIPTTVPDYKLSKLLCSGSMAISDGDYETARRSMKALRDSIGLTAPREIYMANVCMSGVALAEKKYDDAIDCIKWILSDNSGINDADVHMEVYDLLSKFSALGGNKNMADYYRMKFYESKDSLISGLVALEPTRIGIELDNIKEDARKIEEDRERIWMWLIFSIVIVLALAGVSIVVYRKNRALSLKNKVIFDQTQSLLQSADTQRGRAVKPTATTSGDVNKKADPSGEDNEKPEKYRDSSMTDETRRTLIGKIEEVMRNVDEICDRNFSLQKLTSLVGSNTSYISRTVNEHYGMTFGNLLNRYRIQEACRRMGDYKNYGHLTIEAISESVGFNTRATFVKAFRTNIGMLPSEYTKLLKKERNSEKESQKESKKQEE